MNTYTIEDMIVFARNKGGECHSTEYVNSHTPLEFECSNNHIFILNWNTIQSRGRWCKLCSKEERLEKYSIEKIKILKTYAKSRGGNCYTDVYINSNTKYKWECSEGHQWDSTWNSVGSQNTWCPHCAGQTPYIIEDLQKLAISRGGKLLSKNYINTDTKYDWECNHGHQFSNRWGKVNLYGQWCSICNKSGINEELLRVAFEAIFQTKFNKAKPQWLKSPNNTQMELDGFSKKLSIAFEYQGIQHFKKTSQYITTDIQLDKRIKFDKHKKKLCKENDIYLIDISYETNFRDFAKEIKKKCIDLGFPIPKYDFDCRIEWGTAYIKDDRLNELKELVESKDGKLLSDAWLGVKEHYSVKCNECGIIWKAMGSELLGGSWCDKCARSKAGERTKLGINALNEFANKFGGKCLSEKYVKRYNSYDWECSKGHKFTKNFNNMLYRNQFCPTCDGITQRKTSEYYKKKIIEYLKIHKSQYVKGIAADLNESVNSIQKTLFKLTKEDKLIKERKGKKVFYQINKKSYP